MANPNIINFATVTERSTAITITTTSANSLLSSTSGSSQSLAIRSLYVANPGASAVNCTVNYYSQAALAGTAFPICSALSIPANATLLVIDRNSDISIEEDRSLGIIMGTASSSATALVSWTIASTN